MKSNLKDDAPCGPQGPQPLLSAGETRAFLTGRFSIRVPKER
jgi:hypothetical protein